MKRFSEERKTVDYDQFDNTIQQILEVDKKKDTATAHECMFSDRRYQTKHDDDTSSGAKDTK